MNGLIYCATNIHNNKMYIGVTTTTLETRKKYHIMDRYKKEHNGRKFYKALNEYGVDSFSWKVLEDSVPLGDLIDYERIYIDLFDTYNTGYNSNMGGTGSCDINVQENNKKFLHKLQIDKQEYFDSELLENIKTDKKYIYQYTIDGKLVGKFLSIADAIKDTPFTRRRVRNCLLNKQRTHYGYIWSYIKSDAIHRHIPYKDTRKKVYQFNLDGQLLNEYSSICEASRETGIEHNYISRIANDHFKSTNGYMWSFTPHITPYKNKAHRRVVQHTLDNEYVNEYKSMWEASKCTGIHSGNIHKSASGKNKTAGGYVWKYKEMSHGTDY